MSPGLGGLRRLTQPAPEEPASATAPVPDETCEMCGVGIAARHGHVADTHDHRLLCVCRPCHLLFAPDGAGGARFRGVGDTVRALDDLVLDEADWDGLQIPVDLAFFFRHSDEDAFHAFYPGPGGATESTLDLTSWTAVLDANPEIAAMMPDVEAVLLRHLNPGFSAHVTPIDVCYELVGIVREHWEGLHGGDDVWQRIATFFEELDRRGQSASRAG